MLLQLFILMLLHHAAVPQCCLRKLVYIHINYYLDQYLSTLVSDFFFKSRCHFITVMYDLKRDELMLGSRAAVSLGLIGCLICICDCVCIGVSTCVCVHVSVGMNYTAQKLS